MYHMQNFKIIKSVLVFSFLVFTEIILGQIAIGKPNLGFSSACAGKSFNTYDITFTFSPVSALNASNQFIVELSDATGGFSNPTIVFSSSTGSINSSPATLSFGFPETVYGEAYKIRIKSTAPVATSGNSASFPAYFKSHDTAFSINNLEDTAVFCSGFDYLLTIDNPGTGANISPLQDPSLTFNWYRVTGLTTSDFVAAGDSLRVSQAGTYFAETNYGSCTSKSFSNRVTVTESSSVDDITTISSSLGNPFCAINGEATVLSAVEANSYQWFLGDVEIPNATSQTYNAFNSGVYKVELKIGSCQTSATINLENQQPSSFLNVPDANLVKLGEVLTVIVTTEVVAPKFVWYLDGEVIPEAISDTYEATESGEYLVEVIQNEGCSTSNKLNFTIETSFPPAEDIPNLISPNNDKINDTWIIPKEYLKGTNTEITILNSQGKVVLQTTDYENNWPQNSIDFKEVNPVYYYIIQTGNNKIKSNKTKRGSITVIK